MEKYRTPQLSPYRINLKFFRKIHISRCFTYFVIKDAHILIIVHNLKDIHELKKYYMFSVHVFPFWKKIFKYHVMTIILPHERKTHINKK